MLTGDTRAAHYEQDLEQMRLQMAQQPAQRAMVLAALAAGLTDLAAKLHEHTINLQESGACTG